ncbi:MAG TPA: CU044_5270 family protein [Solirubrobacterales bacterium]|nr:CU044_5270 family protein [Solirubrobacterales bacterium]
MKDVELLRQFREALPSARDESRETARAALLERTEAAGRTGLEGRAPAWRSRRVRLAVAGVGIAAVLVALPVAIFGGSGRVEPAAADILRETAVVAATREATTPGPGEFLYTRSKSAYLTATPYLPAGERHLCTGRNPCDMTGAPQWSALRPVVRETWVSFDGSRMGRAREVSGEARFVSEDQRRHWVAAGEPPLPEAGHVEDMTLSGSGEFVDASGLPTDPVSLRELIEARKIPGLSGPPGEAETFVLIGDMLRGTYLPAEIRAALYEVTAELPGVELLGKVEDPVGRPGMGVAFTDEKRGTRQELIFDPETSVLLGERVSLVRSGVYGFEAPPGTPIGYTAYLESKVVDSVGKDAPAGAGATDNTVNCYDRPSLGASTAIIHGDDPVATCAEVWLEGAMDTSRGPSSPHLVACTDADQISAHVFPASSSTVCDRLGLVPLQPKLP